MSGDHERRPVDWGAVRARLARQNAALEDIFSGRGRWADAVLDRRAAELAVPPQMTRISRTAVLIARGAEMRYALALRHLAHIVPLPRLARVPGAPPAVLGVIATGGRVMRLFDLDRLCGGGAADGTAAGDGYAVVLRTGDRRPAALRLATVERVEELDLSTFAEAPPEPDQRAEQSYVRGLTAERVAILDMAAILDAVTAA